MDVCNLHTMSRIMPAMSDGRMTNYTSRCELNADIQRQFNITSESQYRAFLQENPQLVRAFTIERYNQVLPYYNVTPCTSSAAWPTQTAAPYRG